MRYLKVILLGLLTVFALLAGIFTTLLVALVATARLVTRRARPGAPPSSPGSAPRQPSASAPRAAQGDVIDVVAHEVPAAPETTEHLR